MSLLLQALKKSEDERAQRRNEAPIYAGNAAPIGASARSNLAIWAALVFGGIAAGLAAWVFFGGKAPSLAIQPAANSAPSIGAKSNMPEPSATPPAEVAVAAQPVAAAPPEQPALASPNRTLFTDPPPTAQSTSLEAAPATAAVPAPKPIPVAKVAAPALAPVKSNTPNTSPSVASVKSDKEADTTLRIDKKISSSDVVAYAELPPEIRAELPALRLSGYMHAEQSSERLIAINDKLVRVGDEVQPGLQVMSLTASVVIMSYKGYRFRVAQ
jgi:general secretion pathway protein B